MLIIIVIAIKANGGNGGSGGDESPFTSYASARAHHVCVCVHRAHVRMWEYGRQVLRLWATTGFELYIHHTRMVIHIFLCIIIHINQPVLYGTYPRARFVCVPGKFGVKQRMPPPPPPSFVHTNNMYNVERTWY